MAVSAVFYGVCVFGGGWRTEKFFICPVMAGKRGGAGES